MKSNIVERAGYWIELCRGCDKRMDAVLWYGAVYTSESPLWIIEGYAPSRQGVISGLTAEIEEYIREGVELKAGLADE